MIAGLMLILMIVLTSCGPVATKTYTPPGIESVKKIQESAQSNREQSRFRYQENSQDCRNHAGIRGYNPMELGQCGLITDLLQVKKMQITQARSQAMQDFRGALFFRLDLPDGTDFSNLNLQNTIWIEVRGRNINFQNSDRTGATYIHTQLD